MYAVGDKFADLASADFGAAPATLVMFVRSGCKYCTASADFYKRILERTRRVPVIAVGVDPEDTLRIYLHGLGVRPDKVVSASPGLLRLSATPVLLLVSSERRIQKLWVGQLRSTVQEADVLESTQIPRP
jgi:hypothetical protein